MTGAEEPRPAREIRITCPQLLSYNPTSQREVMSLIISLAGVLGAGWIPAPQNCSLPQIRLYNREKEREEKKNFSFYFLRHTSDVGYQVSRHCTTSLLELSDVNPDHLGERLCTRL